MLTPRWKGRAVIYGKAQPKGSQKAVSRPGVDYTVLVPSNPDTAKWAAKLKRIMELTAPETLIAGPVAMRLTIYLPRPANHYRTGKFAGVLKENAPTWAPAKPDAEKVERNVFDAGTGTWYVDDKQIVAATWKKRYPPDGEWPRVIVECEEIL